MSRIILTDFQAGVRLYGVVQTNADEYTQTSGYADYIALMDEQPTANGEFDGLILATSATLSAPDVEQDFDVTFSPTSSQDFTGNIEIISDAAEEISSVQGIGNNLMNVVENVELSASKSYYGVTVKDLVVGKTYPTPFVDAEIKREVRTAAILHPLVSFVTKIQNTAVNDRITCSFEVHLKDGSIMTVQEGL